MTRGGGGGGALIEMSYSLRNLQLTFVVEDKQNQ